MDMTNAAVDAGAQGPLGVKQGPTSPQDQVDKFRARIASCKRVKQGFYNEWKTNVYLRLGRIGESYSGGVALNDEIQTELNPDWSLTKTKTANLYSQVPTVQGVHENKQYAAAVPPFMKQLNYELGEKRANVGVAMEEVLNDVVNAAGVGGVIVGYAARFEDVQVPAVDVTTMDPAQVQALQANGQMPMKTAPRVTSDKFYTTRISPMDLLWPAEFAGSCFDEADFVGRTGRLTWAVAKNEFKLDDRVKEKVVGSVPVKPGSDLRGQPEEGIRIETDMVTFDEIYYWRYRVDPEEKSFSSIWRLVLVEGMDTPAIDEPWKGQRLVPHSHTYIGACKFPIRLLTLTYISDNPVPPSDSAAGRPQVNDLRRSRSQMFKNRERSVPIRWFDVNRVDPLIQDNLMRGTWQGMIPMQGDGNRAIGEVARASYPSEDFSFDNITKQDLMDTWQIGPNQLGDMSSAATAEEVRTVQGNFTTRIGQERAKVTAFFLGIAEVMAGLLSLYSDFPVLTQPERQAMQQAWNSQQVLHDLVFKIRPDSTIMLDSEVRVQRLMRFLNMTAKSGYINPKPIIVEMAELSGLDPSEVIVDPQPGKPEPASWSFKGDDLVNPLAVAAMVHNGQAPTPQDLQAAQKLMTEAQQGAVQPAPVQPPGEPAQTGVPADPHVPDTANPEWSSASKVIKRSRDVSSNG